MDTGSAFQTAGAAELKAVSQIDDVVRGASRRGPV